MELKGKMVILTGWRGAGKTSLCRRLVEMARARGWSVGGVLSPGRFDGERKAGIDVEDLGSGERRRLAVSNPEYRPGALKGGWLFDEDSLRWGNQALAAAGSPDLLIVDELGPLEFNEGRGWTTGMEALDRGPTRVALAVIRPELLERACTRWPGAQVIEISEVGEVEKIAARFASQILS